MKVELPEFHYCPLCGAPVELQYREGRTRPVCTSCGHIIYVNPIPAVALIVLNARNVLLTLRDIEPNSGKWCLPGGFIEWGENPEEGARRELLEETGITGNEISLIGLYDSITEKRLHVIVVAYQVLTWRGDPVAGDDASDVRWFDINAIPPLAFTVHEKLLADFLGGVTEQ